MEQLYYTSAEKRLDGQSGFGVLAKTSGLSEADVQAIGVYNHYHRPADFDEAGDPASAPQSLSFYGMGAGRYAMTNASYVGTDYTGRPGNFFAHTVVCTVDELGPIDGTPVSLQDHPFWVRWQSMGPGVPAELDGLPALASPTAATIAPFISARSARACFAVILQALVERETRGRRVVLIGAPDLVSKWVFAVCAVLPAPLRLALTFSTYQRDPGAVDVALVGLPPSEVGVLSTSGSQFSFVVIDLEAGTLPPDVVPSPPVEQLVSLVETRDDERLSRFKRTAEALQISGFTDLAALVYLEMYGAGQSLGAHGKAADVAQLLLAASKAAPTAAASAAASLLQGLFDADDPREIASLLAAAYAASVPAGAEATIERRATLAAVAALGDGGTPAWLIELGRLEGAGALRSAIGRGVPAEVWRRAVLSTQTSRTDSLALWWILDEGLASGEVNPSESFWNNIAAWAAIRPTPAETSVVVASARVLLSVDPDQGRNVLGLVTTAVRDRWPGPAIALSGELVRAGAVAGSTQDLDAELLAWALDGEAVTVADVRDVVTQFSDNSGILVALSRTCGSDATLTSLAAAFSTLGGTDGASLRSALAGAGGAEVVVRELVSSDLRTLRPPQVLERWLPPTGLLTDTQMTVVGDAIDLMSQRSDITLDEWHRVERLLPSLRTYPELYDRFLIGVLSAEEVSPLTEQQFSLLEARPDLVNDPRRPRLGLRFALTRAVVGLRSLNPGETIDWNAVAEAARINPGPGLDVASYDAFLECLFDASARARVEPPRAGLEALDPLWLGGAHGTTLMRAYGGFLGKTLKYARKQDTVDSAVDMVWSLKPAQFARARSREVAASIGLARVFVEALPGSVSGQVKKRADSLIEHATTDGQREYFESLQSGGFLGIGRRKG